MEDVKFNSVVREVALAVARHQRLDHLAQVLTLQSGVTPAAVCSECCRDPPVTGHCRQHRL